MTRVEELQARRAAATSAAEREYIDQLLVDEYDMSGGPVIHGAKAQDEGGPDIRGVLRWRDQLYGGARR